MRDVRPSSPQGSCFRRLRSGVRRVKPSSWNGRGREQKGGEGDRGRERVRSAQVRSRPSRAHWGRRGPARLRTRTAKALWLPVRLGARARLSASVSRAGTGREDASTAVPNCGHQGAPEEEEEGGGGGGGERGREGKGERRRGVTGGRGCAPLVLRRHGLRAVVEEALAAAGRLRRGAAAAQHRGLPAGG
ncbi:unnamed protein product, partial [Prorocentrum cordatum]